MPFSPDELLDKLSDKDDKVIRSIIAYIDTTMLSEFFGEPIAIKLGEEASPKILRALTEIYASKGWDVKVPARKKKTDKRALLFTPKKDEKDDNGS